MKAPGRFIIISLSLDHLSSTERPVAKQVNLKTHTHTVSNSHRGNDEPISTGAPGDR